MSDLDLSSANEFAPRFWIFAPRFWLNVNLEVRQLTCEIKKLRARWNPILDQDLYTYRKVFRKKPKRDSWRIRRLK